MDDVLRQLDDKWFDDKFDAVRHTLNDIENLKNNDPDIVEHRLSELNHLKRCVDKKLSATVLNNFEGFASGTSLISDVGSDLVDMSLQCVRARSQLRTAHTNLVRAALQTLQHQRRKARILTVMSCLVDIQALIHREREITSLLEQSRFTDAVNVYRDCFEKLAQSGLNKFTCLDDLRKRFLRSGEVIVEKVRAQLRHQCVHFDIQTFRNVIQAMASLGELKFLSELLNKLMLRAIDDTSVNTILPFTSRAHSHSSTSSSASSSSASVLSSSTSSSSAAWFREVVSDIEAGRYRHSFVSLCELLCNVIISHIKMARAFQQLRDDAAGVDAPLRGIYSACARRMEDNVGLVWAACQDKLHTTLSRAQLTQTNISTIDFVRVINAAARDRKSVV